MKAIVFERYGPPDVLEIREVETPVPGDRDLLIKVEAASVNRSDWEGLIGKPLYARMRGLLRPHRPILGSDVAGRVEAVGSAVESFRPGDEVFGDVMYHGGSAFAEYVTVPETAPIVHKPRRSPSPKPPPSPRPRSSPSRARRGGSSRGTGSSSTAPAEERAPSPCRWQRPRGQRRPASTTASSRTSCDLLAATTCSTTPRRTTRTPATATTSSSTWSASGRCSPSGGPSPLAAAMRWSAAPYGPCCRPRSWADSSRRAAGGWACSWCAPTKRTCTGWPIWSSPARSAPLSSGPTR